MCPFYSFSGGDSRSFEQEVKSRLVRLVQSIQRESVGNEASFSCMPDNSDIIRRRLSTMGGGMDDQLDPVTLFGNMHNRKSADCKKWKPEVPESVGIYHAYVRGFNKDTRSHKLFIVTSGGCSSLCDSYFNLFVDVRCVPLNSYPIITIRSSMIIFLSGTT